MTKALAAIAKDEDAYIQEWIDYHLKLGFDDIFVYQNDWRFKGDKSNPHVHWLELDGKVMQLRAYNGFIQQFSSMFSFGAFFDIDEFLVVRGKSLEQALHERKHLPQFAPNWRLMGSNGLHKGEETSVLKRFTRGEAKLNKHVKQIVNFSWFKSFMQPMPTFINPHCTNGCSFSMSGKLFYGPWQEEGLSQRQDMELFHYAVKTPEELHEKVMRGRADTVLTRHGEEQSYFMQHDKNEAEFLDALDLCLR